MNVSLLISAVTAGAAVYGPAATALGGLIGTEVVKEATKDAYKVMKGTLVDVFGRPAKRAVERIEEDPSNEDRREELSLIVADVPEEDVSDLDQKLNVLVAALAADDVALRVAEVVASIKLDLDIEGNVRLANLNGARTIDVKAKAGGDFDLRDVEMDKGKNQGN